MYRKHRNIILLMILITLSLYGPFVGEHTGLTVKADDSQWESWAGKAWKYFEPGVGVDPDTGLGKAGQYWPYFTEWDLGTYIFAILDAEMIGILPSGGEWGSTNRIDKIITYLETRELTPEGLSYLWYDA